VLPLLLLLLLLLLPPPRSTRRSTAGGGLLLRGVLLLLAWRRLRARRKRRVPSFRKGGLEKFQNATPLSPALDLSVSRESEELRGLLMCSRRA
jgi:hypothetical protein